MVAHLFYDDDCCIHRLDKNSHELKEIKRRNHHALLFKSGKAGF